MQFLQEPIVTVEVIGRVLLILGVIRPTYISPIICQRSNNILTKVIAVFTIQQLNNVPVLVLIPIKYTINTSREHKFNQSINQLE